MRHYHKSNELLCQSKQAGAVPACLSNLGEMWVRALRQRSYGTRVIVQLEGHPENF